MRASANIEHAERIGHICLQHANRFCFTQSEDGQALLLAADILTEVRFLALGLATDKDRSQSYIDRFVGFIERATK